MATKVVIRRIEGADKVLANMLKFGGGLETKAISALHAEANNILKEAMDQCPVETGTLRRSGTVDEPKVNKKNITVEIGFNTEYAAAVHERIGARHKIGKAKYLEDPVNEAAPGLAGRLKARLGGV